MVIVAESVYRKVEKCKIFFYALGIAEALLLGLYCTNCFLLEQSIVENMFHNSELRRIKSEQYL